MSELALTASFKYLCYGSTAIIVFLFFSVGIEFRSRNLTSMDVRFWRLKSVPARKGFMVVRRLQRWPILPWKARYSRRRPCCKCQALFPANTRRWPNVGVMLGQRRRRWTGITSTLFQCFVPAGLLGRCEGPTLIQHLCNVWCWFWHTLCSPAISYPVAWRTRPGLSESVRIFRSKRG